MAGFYVGVAARCNVGQESRRRGGRGAGGGGRRRREYPLALGDGRAISDERLVMCEMLNLFVPAKSTAMGSPVSGLRFVSDGEMQRQFRERFAGASGTILSGSWGKGCLCGFDDWKSFYEVVRDTLERNRVEWVAGIHFWSGDTYEIRERTFDPYDAEACTPLSYGEIATMWAGHPEQRRHRRVVRDLARHIGGTITLRLKSGRDLHGTLTEFDAKTEVGRLGEVTVVAAQVLEVERP
jgi:hypothetical protein